MDDEVALLDAELADAQRTIADLETELFNVKVEWDELYPYDELIRLKDIVARLADKLLEADPEDLETQVLWEETDGLVTRKLLEPELFSLYE